MAIPLAWFDPKVGSYYVSGIFPLAQSALDGHYKLSARMDDRKMHRMGAGPTIETAIDDLEHKIFGGL